MKEENYLYPEQWNNVMPDLPRSYCIMHMEIFLTKNITNSILEVFLIVAIPTANGWISGKDESLALPRNISSESFLSSDNQSSKTLRKRHYFWHTLTFTLFIFVMDSIAAF